jgi:hypothetical protein
MNLLNNVPSFFGDIAVAPMGPNELNRAVVRNPPIEYRLTYINNLHEPVTIGWRNGIKFTLDPIHEVGKSELIARVDLYIAPDIVPDIQRLVSKVTDASSIELKALRDAFISNQLNKTYRGAQITLDYPISIAKLNELGGTIYYHELDCIISLRSIADSPPHPYSEDGRDLTIVDATSSQLSSLGFGYSVELVDNNQEYGDRYLNIGRKVFPIRAIKDPTRRPGIYVVSNHSVKGAVGQEGRTVRRYPFEEAEEQLGIFKTAELAASYGDIPMANKQELLEKEHLLAKLRLESQEQAYNHKQEIAARDRENAILQMERDVNARRIEEVRDSAEHAMKMERERMKDFFDRRMYDRKDSHEIMKWIPSILVGLGSIFMALKAFGVIKAPPVASKAFS